MRDAVHPENWHEWREKGFEWDSNYKLSQGETVLTASGQLSSLRLLKGYAGPENVVTGDPFDEETGHPVKRPGEYGIYWRPSEKK